MTGLAWWIVMIGVPLLGAIFGADLYIHKTADAKNDEKDRQIATLHERISAVTKELYEYKINSASLFSTVGSVSEVKRELASAMDALKGELSSGLAYIRERLDRIVERNDRNDRN